MPWRCRRGHLRREAGQGGDGPQGMNESGRRSMLRVRAAHQHHRVTAVELFFDLVFVFAITQISHALLKDFSLLGGARVTLLFLAVWWVWISTLR